MASSTSSTAGATQALPWSANAHLDDVLFTGSCQTGISLHRQFGGQPGKMLALEMGGNNALVVWDVQDVDAAVHHAIFSAFVSAGQRCTCARRLVVQDNAAGSAFIARLVEVAAKLGIGASDAQPQPFMGPVVSAAVAARTVQAQADMVAKGDTTLLQMRQLNPAAGFVTAAASVWSFSSRPLSGLIEKEAAGNIKRTWVNHGRARDWFGAAGEGRAFLRAATEVKTVWVPYGE